MEYTCELCHYKTGFKSNLKKHKKTKKHIKKDEKANLGTLVHIEQPIITIETADESSDSEVIYCPHCNKMFNRLYNLNRHLINCNHNKLQVEIMILKSQLSQNKDHYHGILEEKDKCIAVLSEQNKNMSKSHLQIIQNNIITMNPIKFLNTYCSNNPTFEEVITKIKDSELSDINLDSLNEGIISNNKTILGSEIDAIIKKANKMVIDTNNITTGTCDNVLFVNDGSGRKFITKGNPGWDYYQNDDLLDSATCELLEKTIQKFNNSTLFSKKERETINKVIKFNNDYSKYKELLLKDIADH